MNVSTPLRILATAYDYRPGLGGVATCAFETLKALSQIPSVELHVLAKSAAGSSDVDSHAHFETRRVPLSNRSYLAAAEMALVTGHEVIRRRPDAILNFLWMPCGLATYLAAPARWPGHVPYFVYAHGVEVLETNRTLFKRIRAQAKPLKRHVFQKASAVFAVSHFTAGLVMRECGVSEDKISIVHNGVNLQDFTSASNTSAIEERHGLAGRKVFFTISRLEDYKGIDYALRAIAVIRDRHPEVLLLVGGEGPDRARLETLTRDLKLEGHVQFVGRVSERELPAYYRAAQCFVLLSRSDFLTPNVEGFGIVFLEAAACSKPSIAGNSGGIPDAVENGKSGWLVNPTDVNAIALAMDDCLKHPEKAEEMGRFALERVRARFLWQHSARKIFERINQNVRNCRTRS